LDGPIVFVDRESRIAISNQVDSRKTLSPVDGVFTGRIPSDVMIANTAVQWNETKWTMLLWPLPEDRDERRVLLAHEAWHRIQEEIGFPSSGAANNHLNTLSGRYWLQLEWRALKKALRSSGNQQTAAITDAICFRLHRNRLFPGSQEQERAMELHEGLAEYTGVRLALDPAKGITRTISHLENRPAELETFVRSFAYVSGPSYGLLLDQLMPDWVSKVTAKSDLAGLLRDAIRANIESDLDAEVNQRSQVYGGEELWIAEKSRDEKRIAQIESLTKKYTTGPRLIIPLKEMNMSFNPNELIPLGETGTYYPTLTVADKWGVLKVTGGAMIASDFQSVIVAVPDGFAGSLKTTNWDLEPNESWNIDAGKDGVFKLDLK
jgi:hypothetical protein